MTVKTDKSSKNATLGYRASSRISTTTQRNTVFLSKTYTQTHTHTHTHTNIHTGGREREIETERDRNLQMEDYAQGHVVIDAISENKSDGFVSGGLLWKNLLEG